MKSISNWYCEDNHLLQIKLFFIRNDSLRSDGFVKNIFTFQLAQVLLKSLKCFYLIDVTTFQNIKFIFNIDIINTEDLPQNSIILFLENMFTEWTLFCKLLAMSEQIFMCPYHKFISFMQICCFGSRR